MYIDHSACIPAASPKGESPSDYCVLVGIAFSEQQLLKACINETASISTKYVDMADASVALVKDNGYVFADTVMDLHCAFRLRAPFIGQQRDHAEVAMTLSRLHLGKSFIPFENVAESMFDPISSLDPSKIGAPWRDNASVACSSSPKG